MSAILTIDALCMHFGGLKALSDINITVQAHTITALIGPNGAGKTTLFNCLTGFYQPDSGQIIYHDQHKQTNLRTVGTHHIAQIGIARTFQHARLFREMTVIENMLVGNHLYANRYIWSGLLKTKAYLAKEAELIKRSYEWLRYFQLGDDANRVAGTLPFGKQRLLEIARALCIQPRILCLDEPAAGLNPFESQALSRLLVSLKKDFGVTLILIEHDMSVVMNISDEICVLVKGQVIAQGRPEQIKQDSKVIEAYLGQESNRGTL